MKRKSDAPEALDQHLADTRDIRPPETIRSDDAPELKDGRFAEICRKRHIKREFTSASAPRLNGVAERGLTLIEKVAKVGLEHVQYIVGGQKNSFILFIMEVTECPAQQLYWPASSGRIVCSRVPPVCRHRPVLYPRGIATLPRSTQPRSADKGILFQKA